MIKGILATDSFYGIGKDGTLPWPKNTEDLKHFKELTTGHIVVMGSKTWNDPCFPAPLKNRDNYVITSKTEGFEGATLMTSNFKQEILDLANSTDKTVWIIGGASIFEQTMDIIDEFRITQIAGNFHCDTHMHMSFKDFDEEITQAKESRNIYYTLRRK